MQKINYWPVIVFTAAAVWTGLSVAPFLSEAQAPGEEIVIDLDPDAEAEPSEAESAEPETPTQAPPAVTEETLESLQGKIAALETQTEQLLANQDKIQELLVEIGEVLRQTRIYASRVGGPKATSPLRQNESPGAGRVLDVGREDDRDDRLPQPPPSDQLR